MKFSILFVCYGNICRSPAAEGLLKHKVASSSLEDSFYIDSAGVGWSGISRLPSTLMREVAANHNISLDSYSRGVCQSDFRKFDFLIPMDRDNYVTLLSLCPNEISQEKIVPATFFLENKTIDEVPDPYGGNREDYEFSFQLIDRCVSGLFTYLLNKLK